MAFGTILGVIAIIAAVWVIYDVLVNNRRLSDGMKILWIVFAVFFSIITAIIYYLVGRNQKSDLFRKNKMNKKGSIGSIIFFMLAVIGGYFLLKYLGVL